MKNLIFIVVTFFVAGANQETLVILQDFVIVVINFLSIASMFLFVFLTALITFGNLDFLIQSYHGIMR